MTEQQSYDRKRFLDDFQDEGIPEDLGWKPEEERARQFQRTWRATAVAKVAQNIPRRLGGEASGNDLREDKRLSRQIANRLFYAAQQWSEEDLTEEQLESLIQSDPDLRKQGAQVIWKQWWPEHKRVAEQHLMRAATQAKRHGKIRDGNRMAGRLVNELKFLDELFGET